MTFSWEATIHSAQRCYEKFMRTEMWGISYFYALEQNPGRDGYDVHALWCDCMNKSRKEIWGTWFDRYGRARIEPVNSRDDIADCCAKSRSLKALSEHFQTREYILARIVL